MLKPYHLAEVAFTRGREIGADGQNSKTFLATDVQLGAEIVVKQIAKARLRDPDAYFSEARALYISAHQNVVQLHYACQDGDHVYLAMPFYAAGSVKGLLAQGHLTVREIIRLGCQTLCGLHNIHSKGLIHFDIKPDNILLSPRGEALLSDFGLAKQTKLGVAEPDGLYLRMAPPEAVNGPPYTLSFDVYQMGLTLYRMCVGPEEFELQFAPLRLPDGSIDRQRLAGALSAGSFPDRRKFPHHIPRSLRTLVTKCLAVNPDDRFPSALAIANALAKIDGCLDWRYEGDGVNAIWRKTIDGAERRFTVNEDGSTEFVTLQPDGRRRRTLNACKPQMTSLEIERVLREN